MSEENKDKLSYQPPENNLDIEQGKIQFGDEKTSSEKNVLPEIEPVQITPLSETKAAGTDTIIPPQPKEMEVHHHTHPGHHKKKWTDYFWEFLMLFLAVFCGFLAEYQLEHVIENSKEKEYIASMITDVENDKATLYKAILANQKAATGLDSLANLCYEFENTDEKIRLLYRLFGNYAANFESARFTERTRTQLKNSGNMRLIRSKAAADSITLYDNSISEVLTQEGTYSEFMKDEINAAQQLFNFKYFQQRSSKLQQTSASIVTMSVLAKNPADLVQYGNKIFILRGILLNYIGQLKQMEIKADKLITLLKTEYH